MKRTPRLGLLGAMLCGSLAVAACQPSGDASSSLLSKDGTPQASYVYKTVGDLELTLTMDYPPTWSAADARPAVVFFFGGGWNRGSVDQFQPQAQYFAQRGMICARADYRTVSKDGLPHKSVEDALAAMRWIRRNARPLGIDPDRIVAAGGSAGGLLAACTFFLPEPEGRVSARPNAMLLYNPRLSAAERGTPGVDEQARRAISPAYLARDAQRMVPTLIVVGSKDDQTLTLVRRFVRDVQGRGGPVEIETVAGQQHGFFNYMPWLAETTQRADVFFESIGYLTSSPRVELPSEDALERPEHREQDEALTPGG